MRVITNNSDFAKYLQSKMVEVYYRTVPQTVGKDDLYIIFPTTRYINMSGNRYIKQHKDTGGMHDNYKGMLDWFKVGDKVIQITSVCSFGSRTMQRYEEDLYLAYELLKPSKYCIDTWQLGELVNLRKIQVWSNNDGLPKLKPVVLNKPLVTNIKYGKGKQQDQLNFNVFKNYRDADLRHKLRRTVEFSLYSEIYKQIVREVLNNGRV